MKKLGKMISLLLLAAFTMLYSGCAAKEQQIPINVALPDDIISLDILNSKDALSETVGRCIFSTLYTFDENMQLVPSIAESSEHISDLEWIFHLRKNIKFHDGSPLTAKDVKYSLERAKNLKSPDNSLVIIDTLDVIDDYTLKVNTVGACVNLPNVFVRVSTSVMSKNALEKPDYDFNKPIGSGPFKLKERIVGKSISLESFDGYFLEPAKNRYLNFLVEPSEQERTSGLLNGTNDVVFRVSSYDCDALKLDDNVKVYAQASTKMELMIFNPNFPPFNDILVRQAIAHAINRQNLVDNVLGGYGTSLDSLLPPPLVGSINCDNFTYNPELSRNLLEEAGYSNTLEFTVTTFDMMRKKMMEYIKLDLAEVGIKMNYECLDLNKYLSVINNNSHKASIISWVSNTDPDSTFSQLYSKDGTITVNQCSYSDPKVEDLIIQGKHEADPKKREQIYIDANKIVCDSYFYLPIFQPDVLVAASNTIEGIQINPQGIFGYENLYRVKNDHTS